jgi:hypothetical protein
MKTHIACYYANKIMATYKHIKQPLQQEEAIMGILFEMEQECFTPWYKKLYRRLF